MTTINNCPICNDAELDTHLECIDALVSHETFRLSKCRKCGFVFTNGLPKMDKLGQYYHSENYISHSNSNKGLMNKAYKIVRSYTLAQKTKLLGKAEGKLLEIGSGTGELLANCEKKGWECQGVEPEEVARKAAFQNHSLKLLASIDELSIQENSLDRIMLWHVLEHVPNLHQTIEKFKGWLKKDGLLFVAVPNHKSWDAKHYKENWAAYDVPRHLYHFDKESMNKLFGQHALEIKQTRAMLFDSFYISMLSEEIKNGQKKMIKGAIAGLISNLSATLKSGEYSSHLYLIGHKIAV
jgi:2-polyprenyl-3-methyl-5-hydroxy-6-metoxy-1,4-benzoquinol methylase